MRPFALLAALAALSSAAPAQDLGALMSPPVKRDVQCLILYAVGVDMAKDEKVKHAASLGLMYFVGKLQVGAPGLDLGKAVREEVQEMEGNPATKAAGAACDAEVQERGDEMMKLGRDLIGTDRPTSSS